VAPKEDKKKNSKGDKKTDKETKPEKEVKETKDKETKEKEKKPKDKKEKTGDEKPKDGLNNATREAGLFWNVNSFRDWAKKQFGNFGIAEDSTPMMASGHVALSAACESMCTQIVSAAETSLKKEKAGLYTLGKAAVSYTIQINDNLEYTFYHALKKFDSDTDYRELFCIPTKDVAKLVEKSLGNNIKIDETGYNIMAYLLNQFSVRLLRTAVEVMTSSGKKSLSPKFIMSAVRIHCRDAVSMTVNKKIEDAVHAAGPQAEEGEGDKKEGEDAEKKTDGDKKKKKSKGDAKKEEVAAKEAPKVVNEEDDSDEGSDDEDDEKDKKKPDEKKAKKDTAKPSKGKSA